MNEDYSPTPFERLEAAISEYHRAVYGEESAAHKAVITNWVVAWEFSDRVGEVIAFANQKEISGSPAAASGLAKWASEAVMWEVGNGTELMAGDDDED